MKKWIGLAILAIIVLSFTGRFKREVQRNFISVGAAQKYCSKFEDQENLFEKCKDETRALYREYEGIIEKKCGKPKKPSEEPEGSFPQNWGECANNIIKNIKN